MSKIYRRCYTCLNNDTANLVRLQAKDQDGVSYLEKLKTCIKQELIRYDPMVMCSKCVVKLRISYVFHTSVLNSQVVLKLQKRTGIKVQIPQRIVDKCDVRITRIGKRDDPGEVKNEVKSEVESEVKSETKIEFPANTIDLTSDLSQPFKEDLGSPNHVSADEDSSFFNFEDLLQIKPRVAKPEKPKPKIGEKPPRVCTICFSKFNKLIELRRHMADEHNETRTHVCTYCPQRFRHSFSLREHLAQHTGETNYACQLCDKKFVHLSSHLRHKQAHERPPGQKSKRTPFLCTICGKTFQYTNGRSRHMKIHMGIKNFQCAVCNRLFSAKHHLITHMRIHTGEKPYICDVCGQAFSIKACMDAHIRSKHGTEGSSLLQHKKSKKLKTSVQSMESEGLQSHFLSEFYAG